MKKVVFLTVLLFLCFLEPTLSSVNTTEDPVLLRINGREITLSDFEYVYTKNNLNPQVMDPRSIEEYLELFINFNLKVYEALQLGLDTNPSFITELDGYRKQLAQPYLTDQNVSNQILDEALERLQYDIRASHILFNLDNHATPQDTIRVWNRAMEVRKRILAGEDFSELARQFSDDPSAKGMPATANRPAMRGNGGDLGYFTVLDMVYPFESAAYSLAIGEVSLPVRSSFGYHLIKVNDRLPAMGRARVAHIMVAFEPDATNEQINKAEEKIKEIHQKLLAGEDFAVLAERFSDDKSSGRRGGEMPAFTSNRMVPEFIKAISGLSADNPFSGPVKTQYGWHLIRFFERQHQEKDVARNELKNRISRDTRAALSQQVVIDRLKKEYNYTEDPSSLEVFFNEVDNSIFEARWDKSKISEKDKVVFSFSGKKFTQGDFAEFLARTQTMRSPDNIRSYVSAQFENFVEQSILAYEETRLPYKFPEFKRIMNEYHDGILLFELTDQKVWGKAMKDTTGLKNFFNANVSDYMWNDRFDAVIYTFGSEAAAKSARRQIRRAHRKNIPHDELMGSLNKASQLEVSAEKGVFEIVEKPVLVSLSRKKGISSVLPGNSTFSIVWVNEFLPSQPKKLSEIRGLVIADYQNYLEEKWVEELRQKYNYTLYKDVLKQLGAGN